MTSPYSVLIPENTYQRKSEYAHFIRSKILLRGSNTSQFREITLTYKCKAIDLEHNWEGSSQHFS